MKINLPTRERCQEIVKNSEAFYCMEKVVEGQKVELYDYRLVSISDFVDNDAFELRGLTFVQTDNGTWERNILLNKFFNVNQTTMDDLLELVINNGDILRVNETHNFQVKSNSDNINNKMARDLTERDNIVSWDEIKPLSTSTP